MSAAPAKTKRSAFSCHQCRVRKVKCGAESPSCKRCVDRGETCVYKLAPTLSYTERLERRVRELEDELIRVKGNTSSQSPQGSTRSLASEDRKSDNQLDKSPAASATTRFGGLKLDDKGVITYHGSTSFFQSFSHHFEDSGSSSSQAGSPRVQLEGGGKRERLVTNAWQQRALETLSQIPEPFQYLLSLHWCWIQPLFNFIYRPAFSRDIEVMGPYYSHTLMNAVISHSIRWGKHDPEIREKLKDYDEGALFGRQARSLIFEELNQGVCTVPTVQSLLLLGAAECSAGNSTQAWVYSGIAFRLIDHLGICIDVERYASNVQLSDEDIEIRHRLFWSCYFFDKMISLYLGRSPSLQHSTVSPPQIMLDDSGETETWTPQGVSFPDGQQYPPTASHSTSCFMKMCQLSVIFNQILIHIYDPLQQNTASEIQACVISEGDALNRFWADLPPHLRLEINHLPSYAPPSHIVTLNCLYHTFRILLYRPTLTRSTADWQGPPQDLKHLVDCVSSAVSIIAIFDLFCRSFGIWHCILSLSYSVYIAASIFLLQVEAAPEDEQAFQRLAFCVQSLERVKSFNPVIGSALKPIYETLERLQIEIPIAGEQLRARPNDGGSMANTSGLPFQPRDVASSEQMLPGVSDTQNYIPFDISQMNDLTVPDHFLEVVSGLNPLSVRIGPEDMTTWS